MHLHIYVMSAWLIVNYKTDSRPKSTHKSHILCSVRSQNPKITVYNISANTDLIFCLETRWVCALLNRKGWQDTCEKPLGGENDHSEVPNK